MPAGAEDLGTRGEQRNHVSGSELAGRRVIAGARVRQKAALLL